MALSNPRSIFGVHSFSPYSRTDGTFYGILKVLASSSLAFSGTLVPLKGGSNKYSWGVEEGEISSQLSLKTREYPDFLFTLFMGIVPTSNAAETSGNVSTLTNVYGTSVKHATTGIATALVIATTGPANLKFAKFVVKAVSATTVDVFASSDLDFARGSAGSYTTDGLKVAAAQTITASTALNLTEYGVKLTGGSGTIGMTTSDTATFETRPINTISTTAQIGGVAATFPEFGAIVYAKKKGTGEMFEIDCPKCKGSGLPLSFDENKYSEADIKIQLMYDPTLDYVARMRNVVPTSAT